jgi:hypothetical protein
MHNYRARHLSWDGLTLRLGKRVVATVIPDPEWPNMYRVKLSHAGQLSDMVNLTRAKDAAVCLATGHLNLANAA